MAYKESIWPFYVYEIINLSGETIYVGKGSGRRLRNQVKNFNFNGCEIARFKKESDAYAFEVQKIAEIKPVLNKHVGGNGSKVTIKRERKQSWQILIDRIGTRAYAARLLLAFCVADPSKIDEIRQVAYGTRE